MVYGDPVQMARLYICHEITDMMTYYKLYIQGNCCNNQILRYGVVFGIDFLTFFHDK